MNVIAKILRTFRQERRLRNEPLRLEFVVTDFCNLNCRGCTHFSPLAPKEFVPLDALCRDMEHLGAVCREGVSQVYLIGGEPLLYPQLTEAIEAMRKAFPTQKLYIFTNGLTLGRMPEQFWEAARRNNIIIAITRYPVNFDYYAVESLCRQQGVEILTFGDRSQSDTFFRFALDPKKRQNKYLSHLKCYNRGCVSVVDGYVYPCSTSACAKHLNRTGHVNFEHLPADRIAVGEVKSAKQIKKLRDHAVPFCSYCVNPPRPLPYARSKRDLTEWVNQD